MAMLPAKVCHESLKLQVLATLRLVPGTQNLVLKGVDINPTLAARLAGCLVDYW